MGNSILIALNDSVSSRAVLNYVTNLSLRPEESRFTLVHFFRKPHASEELMGKKFSDELPGRFMAVLKTARDKLIEKGFDPDKIETRFVDQHYPTVADGIIDQFKKGDFNMVVIGRKHMSKAEEFVMGDVSVKLIRELKGIAVLVIKSH